MSGWTTRYCWRIHRVSTFLQPTSCSREQCWMGAFESRRKAAGYKTRIVLDSVGMAEHSILWGRPDRGLPSKPVYPPLKRANCGWQCWWKWCALPLLNGKLAICRVETKFLPLCNSLEQYSKTFENSTVPAFYLRKRMQTSSHKFISKFPFDLLAGSQTAETVANSVTKHLTKQKWFTNHMRSPYVNEKLKSQRS